MVGSPTLSESRWPLVTSEWIDYSPLETQNLDLN
jgi:hypothetical protein